MGPERGKEKGKVKVKGRGRVAAELMCIKSVT